jgi:hypothetical protein
MSIIFQKLENLKDRSSENEGLQGSKFQQRKNIYTFRKLIFSPRGAFLIFATIAIFTLISFYALSFLKNYLDSGSSKAIVVQRHQSDQLPAGEIRLHNNDSPKQPHSIDPVTRPPVGIPGSPPGIEPAVGVPASSVESEEFKVPESFIFQTKSGSSGDTVDPDISDARDTIKFLPSLSHNYTPEKQTKIFDHLSPLTAVNKSTQAVVKTKYQTNIDKIRGRDRTIKATLKHVTSKENISSSGKQKSVFPEKQKDIEKAAIRFAKQKRTRKVSIVATLAADLEDAFEKEDNTRIDRLLARLARIKGENNLYYLKLTAFREIKRKNYTLAKKLLNRVLAKNKTDFEAGINMAIIEISQQEFTRARQRLIRLKELYPSQSSVDDLLNLL